MALSRRREKILGRLGRRSTREREGLVLVEGIRAVETALEGGADPRFALVSPRLDALGGGPELAARLSGAGFELDRVGDDVLARVSDTERHQGVALVCVEPTVPLEELLAAGRRHLVLDALQDPGNAGTLIRAATAFGLDGVVALDGTVDPWNPKTVRASAGLAFRIPLATARADTFIEEAEARAVPIWVADASGDPVARGGGEGSWALVVGNEGAGPRASLIDAAVRVLRIPMRGPAESLNAGVAGAILLYALTEAA